MILVSAIIFAVALGAAILRPAPPPVTSAPNIDAMLPERFGEWRQVALGRTILPAEMKLGAGEAVAYRAYRDKAGRIITLVAAYGPPLGDSVRLHRPEACYVAQGFAIKERWIEQLELNDSIAPVVQLRAENATRRDAVSYLLRDGDAYVVHESGHEILNVKRNLRGFSDGALIRISSEGDSDSQFVMHGAFIKEFAGALSPTARKVLLAHGL